MRKPSPIRLGNHSIAPSPRERSPHRHSSHKNRSRSPDKRPSKLAIPLRKSPPVTSALQEVEEVGERKAQGNSSEEKVPGPAPSEGKQHHEFPINDKIETPSTMALQGLPTTKLVKEEMKEVKIEKSEQLVSPPVENNKANDVENNKMDVVESPTVHAAPSLSPAVPSLSTQPSVKLSSAAFEPQRGSSHTAQAQPNWPYPPKVTRSPPRAPRGYRLAGHQTSIPVAPREPRRNYGLPNIPKYERPKHMAEFEQEVSLLR